MKRTIFVVSLLALGCGGRVELERLSSHPDALITLSMASPSGVSYRFDFDRAARTVEGESSLFEIKALETPTRVPADFAVPLDRALDDVVLIRRDEATCRELARGPQPPPTSEPLYGISFEQLGYGSGCFRSFEVPDESELFWRIAPWAFEAAGQP